MPRPPPSHRPPSAAGSAGSPFLSAREDHVMRVLVAPDSFGGTLTALEAAAAIAAGFRTIDENIEVHSAPLSDGGPGFIDVLATAIDGEHRTQTVRGPLGDPVGAEVLVADGTAYVECAQAAGLHLIDAG